MNEKEIRGGVQRTGISTVGREQIHTRRSDYNPHPCLDSGVSLQQLNGAVKRRCQ